MASIRADQRTIDQVTMLGQSFKNYTGSHVILPEANVAECPDETQDLPLITGLDMSSSYPWHF
jgi:hypothetical protein